MANAYGIDIYEGEHAPSSSQPRSSLENSGGSIHWLHENPSLSLLIEPRFELIPDAGHVANVDNPAALSLEHFFG
jgi:hypothetical protein